LRLVVFGWGNDARGDDGLGPLLLARVARAAWADVTTVEDFQLQIEHALDLDGAEAALFLDAGKDTPAPFSFAEIGPERDESHTTHALAPEAVLDVYARSKPAR
jgi:hydrogenase maturation protease